MNERMKILQMLSEGKITPEQAESLLTALDTTETRRGPKILDKSTLSELKNLGSQVSAAVTQSLSDARRALEGQLDVFSLSGSASVTVTHDLALPLNTTRVHVQTTNGTIQVSAWDEPYVQIHVRAKAKTNNLNDAKSALISALQTQEQDNLYNLTIVHGERDSDNGVQIIGAHLDISVPKHLKEIYMRSQNGRIASDGVSVEEMHLETTNGSVSLFRSTADRVNITVVNGGIEIVQGISSRTRQLHAQTKNGGISIEGLPANAQIYGRARTSFGKIDVSDAQFDVTFEDGLKRSFARFESRLVDSEDDTTVILPELRLQLETKNGSIRIKP